MEEEVQKDYDDVKEDEREEVEEVEKSTDNEHVVNDVEEDNREEAESLEDLREALKNALYENSVLKSENERLTKERDEAHAVFMNEGRKVEEEKRTFSNLKNDII